MKSTEIREKIVALFCLTVIAIVAMMKLPDSENVVVNVVVAIAAFVTGSAMRRGDGGPQP
jgi:hypothetical protein